MQNIGSYLLYPQGDEDGKLFAIKSSHFQHTIFCHASTDSGNVDVHWKLVMWKRCAVLCKTVSSNSGCCDLTSGS